MPDYNIQLPTLYGDATTGQIGAYNAFRKNRRLAVRCGRRWGKTDLGKVLGADAAIKGYPVGWFAPDYRIMAEAYNEILTTIEPIKKTSSKTEGVMRTITGGRIDFWTLENERAGRSRMYKLVIIDEAAFTKDNMIDIWEQSIEPTLLDLGGKCIVLSNTNGISDENFLYKICETDVKRPFGVPGPKYGFAEYHAPSHQNPHVPRRLRGESEADHQRRRDAEFASIKAAKHPLVFKQEYLAEFVDWSGVAFFNRDSLLVNDQPVPYPTLCDSVFATIDTAVKTGSDNDGTGVIYWALNTVVPGQYKLMVLDWDIVKIEGSLLHAWLPNVYRRLEDLARQCRARGGSLGAWIEDKVSGTILLQQARRNQWPAHAIDSKLTAVGKDERAMSVSGYVYQGLVKVTQHAYDKVTTYNESTRNHFLAQVMGFRLGDKEAYKRADDLLDCFTYGVAIALGDKKGY
jgi:hypothetical protein